MTLSGSDNPAALLSLVVTHLVPIILCAALQYVDNVLLYGAAAGGGGGGGVIYMETNANNYCVLGVNVFGLWKHNF